VYRGTGFNNRGTKMKEIVNKDLSPPLSNTIESPLILLLPHHVENNSYKE
jgi:hypothetical protein